MIPGLESSLQESTRDNVNQILLEWLTTKEEFGSTHASNILVFAACHGQSRSTRGV